MLRKITMKKNNLSYYNVGYLIISFLSLSADYYCSYIFHKLWGFENYISNSSGYALGFLVSFLLYFLFLLNKDACIIKSLFLYLLSFLLGLLVTFIATIIISYLYDDFIVSKMVSIILSFVFVYLLRRRWFVSDNYNLKKRIYNETARF